MAIDRRRRKLDEDVTRLRLEIAARDAASIAVSEEKELEGKPDDQAAASTCAHRGLRAAVLERKLLEVRCVFMAALVHAYTHTPTAIERH